MGAPRPLHVVTSILVGAYLGRRGLRKGSLSKSGAMAVSYTHLTLPTKA